MGLKSTPQSVYESRTTVDTLKPREHKPTIVNDQKDYHQLILGSTCRSSVTQIKKNENKTEKMTAFLEKQEHRHGDFINSGNELLFFSLPVQYYGSFLGISSVNLAYLYINY